MQNINESSFIDRLKYKSMLYFKTFDSRIFDSLLLKYSKVKVNKLKLLKSLNINKEQKIKINKALKYFLKYHDLKKDKLDMKNLTYSKLKLHSINFYKNHITRAFDLRTRTYDKTFDEKLFFGVAIVIFMFLILSIFVSIFTLTYHLYFYAIFGVFQILMIILFINEYKKTSSEDTKYVDDDKEFRIIKLIKDIINKSHDNGSFTETVIIQTLHGVLSLILVIVPAIFLGSGLVFSPLYLIVGFISVVYQLTLTIKKSEYRNQASNNSDSVPNKLKPDIHNNDNSNNKVNIDDNDIEKPIDTSNTDNKEEKKQDTTWADLPSL